MFKPLFCFVKLHFLRYKNVYIFCNLFKIVFAFVTLFQTSFFRIADRQETRPVPNTSQNIRSVVVTNSIASSNARSKDDQLDEEVQQITGGSDHFKVPSVLNGVHFTPRKNKLHTLSQNNFRALSQNSLRTFSRNSNFIFADPATFVKTRKKRQQQPSNPDLEGGEKRRGKSSVKKKKEEAKYRGDSIRMTRSKSTMRSRSLRSANSIFWDRPKPQVKLKKKPKEVKKQKAEEDKNSSTKSKRRSEYIFFYYL